VEVHNLEELPPLSVGVALRHRLGLSRGLNLATLNQENRKDLITVTNTVAAGGSYSLRVQDHPDLKASYNPHLHWDPQYTKGTARLAYRIRLEPGARVQCEWRNQGGTYRIGPSLQFYDRGVWVHDRKLMDIPENEWCAVEMRADLGRPHGIWTLRVTLPNGSMHAFKDLRCDPAWQTARWVGFISLSPGQSSFYLDDVVMENHEH